MAQRILVTGATGKTGRLVIDKLLARPDNPSIRALVRGPEQAAVLAARGVETVECDVRDAATNWPDEALRDVDALISAMGGAPLRSGDNLWKVDYEGTQRLIAAAKTAGAGLYVFISTTGLLRQRSILRPLSMLFYPKLLAEDAIRGSGIPYVILRPGGLVEEADAGSARNTREQVAEACLAALDRPDIQGKTWEMTAARRAEPGADPIFGVAVDPG